MDSSISRLIKINSNDKLPYSANNSDFNVSFNNVRELSNVKSFIIKHVSFPNNFYNITTTNNTFKYNDGVDQTLVFPPGYYSITQVLNYLIANGPPILYTQDPTNYKILFDNAVAPTAYTLYNLSNGSTIAPLLGITSNITLNIGSSSYAQNLPALQGVEHLYIQSRVLSNGNSMITPGIQNASYICMIPVDEPFGSIVHYESPHEQLDLIEFTTPTDIREIDIRLVDMDGNVLNMQGGSVNIVLKCYTYH